MCQFRDPSDGSADVDLLFRDCDRPGGSKRRTGWHTGRGAAAVRLALKLLAQHEAAPLGTSGLEARDALLTLVEYMVTAAHAAVRLPVALLDDAQRQRLVESWETRRDLLEKFWLPAPLSLVDLRDSHVLRSVVLIAHDAAQL